jgi:hypothetical protein
VLSNVVPRRDTTGAIVNAHAGGIYNFSSTFYLIGEHYKNCPHAGENKTKDPLAFGDCEMCGHTGTSFALYTSDDLNAWTLNTTNVIPNPPGGTNANLYTPVFAYNAKHSYYVMLFQCTGGCTDGQLQVSTAASPAGPFIPKGAVLPNNDSRSGSSQGGIWVDDSSPHQTGYLIFNSIGNEANKGQWIVELDDTYLRMTNRSAQIVAGAVGSEAGFLEGGGIFRRGDLYYFMAGSGCCYCAGGGGAMVFVAPHPLGPWQYQTNVNDGLYLPLSPTGPPQLPPPLPPSPSPTDACADLSGEWAASMMVPYYQPLRRGLTVRKVRPPPQPAPAPTGTTGMLITKQTLNPLCITGSATQRNLALEPCTGSASQMWEETRPSVRQFRTRFGSWNAGVLYKNVASGRCIDTAYGNGPIYLHECMGGVGQTWIALGSNSSGEIVNAAAKTCISAQASTVVMGPTGVGMGAKGTQQWMFVPTPAPPTPPDNKDYYNMTSVAETHWPAVSRSGWLLTVDRTTKQVTIATGASHGTLAGNLQPWLNPWANGQKLPPAPDCTMIPGSSSPHLMATMCKLPYCGESVRPVAAQQFNVLSLGGEHLYYGERWQSTLSGLKAEDFSYMEPLRFDNFGVMKRMNFTDRFELPLQVDVRL